MNIKYILKVILAIPFLPIIYFQARIIKARFPKLPEAEGIRGFVANNINKRLRILTIGESSIAGVGVKTHEEGFTGTLAKELSSLLNATVEWKVYAKRGYTAKKVEETIVPQITEKEIDLVVVGLGANDTFQLNNPSRWKKDVQRLIQSLKDKFSDVPIVFINMPPIKELPAFTKLIKIILGNLGEILAEELDKLVHHDNKTYYYSNRITITDWMERFNVPSENAVFFSDGVHPSKLAYQVWARDVAGFIMTHPQIKTTLQLIGNRV
ncbi:SGNH/GDSL hydrolase family protein [Aureispira anguillae]|uniref:SGNH/GDSL hydrolase family protein n=1 Tax=Aureispira anguillae TaxID=2864201 RepID=A0A915YJB4_9BACT|nr:SGNH/GDSL hydrolase family protein [Aureispira anguillae]BDS14252.1 SGNH/GDSL hydrolase family protein [Aureispira anguillae]